MANRVKMELLGLRELNARLAALPREIKKGPILMRALHDGARIIKAEARKLAPVLRVPDPRRRAGELRANIVQHASRSEDDTVVVRVRTRGWIFGSGRLANSALAGNPNYWWLQEFGTSKQPARPFLRPAFESQKFNAAVAVKNSLARGIQFVADKLSKQRMAA